jgi:hypothetical protein
VYRLLGGGLRAVIDASATASMPSGTITIKEVPTNIPTPILDINRICDCESVMESGNAPAKNELLPLAVGRKSSDRGR